MKLQAGQAALLPCSHKTHSPSQLSGPSKQLQLAPFSTYKQRPTFSIARGSAVLERIKQVTVPKPFKPSLGQLKRRENGRNTEHRYEAIGADPYFFHSKAEERAQLQLHKLCAKGVELFNWRSGSLESSEDEENSLKGVCAQVVQESRQQLSISSAVTTLHCGTPSHRMSLPHSTSSTSHGLSPPNGSLPLSSPVDARHLQSLASHLPFQETAWPSLDQADPFAAAPSAAAAPSTSVSTALERCYVSHPGSMCCSTARVERDPANNTCVVSLRTTVRLTESQACPNLADLEELGWVATKDTAADIVTVLNQKSTLPCGNAERHGWLVDVLQNGRIVETRKQENGFGHVSYVVKLEDKHTGRSIKALFKPRVDGDCDGWHRVPIEVAAYNLNMLLGMDLVPPAVYRKDCHVDWHHYTQGGSFIYWCSNSRELSGVKMREWSMKPSVLLSDTRILDVLIQNSDRHEGHFLYGEHWANGINGSTDWKGSMAPVLIDQSAGFRPGAYVALDHENAFSTGATKLISARTYMRLRFLDRATLSASIGGLVTPEEISGILQRRDEVLKFFDNRVSRVGYPNVVLEDYSHCHISQ